jgi:hypothetical protein
LGHASNGAGGLCYIHQGDGIKVALQRRLGIAQKVCLASFVCLFVCLQHSYGKWMNMDEIAIDFHVLGIFWQPIG